MQYRAAWDLATRYRTGQPGAEQGKTSRAIHVGQGMQHYVKQDRQDRSVDCTTGPGSVPRSSAR